MNKIQRCKLPLSMNDLRRTNNDSFPMNRRHHCTWKRTHDKTLYLSKAPSTTSWSPFHLTGTAKILCPPISLFHRRLLTHQTVFFCKLQTYHCKLSFPYRPDYLLHVTLRTFCFTYWSIAVHTSKKWCRISKFVNLMTDKWYDCKIFVLRASSAIPFSSQC